MKIIQIINDKGLTELKKGEIHEVKSVVQHATQPYYRLSSGHNIAISKTKPMKYVKKDQYRVGDLVEINGEGFDVAPIQIVRKIEYGETLYQIQGVVFHEFDIKHAIVDDEAEPVKYEVGDVLKIKDGSGYTFDKGVVEKFHQDGWWPPIRRDVAIPPWNGVEIKKKGNPYYFIKNTWVRHEDVECKHEDQGHPHKALIMEYAKIAQTEEHPETWVEWKLEAGDYCCEQNLSYDKCWARINKGEVVLWSTEDEYRISEPPKPWPKIVVNGVEINAPIKDEPKYGDVVFYMSREPARVKWGEFRSDAIMLKSGFVFRSKEDALAAFHASSKPLTDYINS